jgi:TetR/AcrR family transcriptional regulator, acrAB operon repressor
MARKTKEEALETRSQLLDAAEKIFFEKGFGQTALMDIAHAANLTRGAIYWHFKNKSDLFAAMADRIRLPLENLTHACADPAEPNPLGKLRDFWVQILRESTRNPRRRRVLSILFFKCELNSEAKQLELRRQAAQIEYLGDMELCLQNAIDRRQLPADLDIHKAAVANQALLAGLISNWLFLPGSFDLDAYAEAMVDGYIFMIKNSMDLREKK